MIRKGPWSVDVPPARPISLIKVRETRRDARSEQGTSMFGETNSLQKNGLRRNAHVRMFNLPSYPHRRESLEALATSMMRPTASNEVSECENDVENPTIPAGYAYLRDFIDHDLTLHPSVSTRARRSVPARHLDLAVVYGEGPVLQPYLYDQVDGSPASPRGMRLLLGEPLSETIKPIRHDVLRLRRRNHAAGQAVIADPRNDADVIVSQLHATFIAFHNRVLAWAAERTRSLDGTFFDEVQRLVRWHYQWTLIHDFLPRITGHDIVDDILRFDSFVAGGATHSIIRPRLLFFQSAETPHLPVEFSAAAFRLGAAMLRPRYRLNDHDGTETSGRSWVPPQSVRQEERTGFERPPVTMAVQWKYFFEMEKREGLPQRSYRIDTRLAADAASTSGAHRTLMLGRSRGLPDGQSVASAMGIEPLDNEQLGITSTLGAAAFSDLKDHAPLWYYILRESEILQAGERLGPVGARIVAEVLIGVIAANPGSYVNAAPHWQPTLPGGSRFAMPDLIRFAETAG